MSQLSERLSACCGQAPRSKGVLLLPPVQPGPAPQYYHYYEDQPDFYPAGLQEKTEIVNNFLKDGLEDCRDQVNLD